MTNFFTTCLRLRSLTLIAISVISCEVLAHDNGYPLIAPRSPLPVSAAYAGTRVYVLTDPEAWLNVSPAPEPEKLYAPCPGNSGDLGGTVFQDNNNNGINDGEDGQPGISVTVFACDGTEVCSTTTDTDGNWTCSGLNDGEQYRVEFTVPASLDHLQPSYTGGDNGSAVQFATPVDCSVNFGVIDPGLFCDEQILIAPCYVEGDASIGLDAVVAWPYGSTGINQSVKRTVAADDQVGGAWGVAFDPVNRDLYASVVVKRHIGLYEGTDGSGTDVIFRLDPFASNQNAQVWLELTDDLNIATDDGNFPSNADRGLAASPNNDPVPFSLAGKAGLGDIEISEDGTTLYVMNLYDRTLYEIDVATKTLTAGYPVPDPGCSNGTYRPWATKYADGTVYIGLICDGSATAVVSPPDISDESARPNLEAFVYRLDGNTFTQVLNFPLDYPREAPFGYSSGTCTSGIDGWYGWVDEIPNYCEGGVVSYPQPILTDIEFDDAGGMILGFADRTGFQFGAENFGITGTDLYSIYAAGDILYACGSNGSWSVEDPANCTNTNGEAINGSNNTYPSFVFSNGWPNVGEYFVGDFFHDGGNLNAPGYFPGHGEIAMGALAYLPGSNEVVSTAYDAITGQGVLVNRGGVIKLSTVTGRRTTNGFELYDSNSDGGITQGKGVGLGDLEILCVPPPVQVGNFAWIDTDGNGIQDACEPPLTDLTVTLYRKSDNGTLTEVATTATHPVTGEYYFSDVLTNTSYVAVFGDQSGPLINADGTDYQLTTAGTGTGNTPDANDSDGALFDLNGVMVPAICFSTADTTDHTLDIGFRAATAHTVTITATETSSCTNGNFEVMATLDWQGAPTTGNFEFSVDGGPYTEISRTNLAADATGEIVTLPGLVCNQARTVRIRFVDSPGCFAEMMFVFPPSDPAGYIYCESTGEIVSGGTITVTPPAGGGARILTENGVLLDGSNGRYAWIATGSPVVAGRYQMTFTPPGNQALTGTPGGFGDGDAVLDPTSGGADNINGDNPLLIGSDVNGTGTALIDFSPAGNPYFLTFDLEQNDPFIDLNNLPVTCSIDCADGPGTIGGNVFSDLNNDGADAGAGESGIAGVLVQVYDCAGLMVCEVLTNAEGNWSCSGLTDGEQYRVEFSTPGLDNLQPGFAGTDSDSDAQIITAPSCAVNYGLLDDNVYCPPAVVENHPIGSLSERGTLLSSGISVVTCGIIDDPAFPPAMQYTLGLIDIRNVALANDRPQAPLMDFHHPDWTVTDIGNVYGTTTDDDGNFYATASSHYGAAFGYALGPDSSNVRASILRYGDIGGGANAPAAAGTVYKMDAATGQPSVFAQLPQQSFAFTHIACEDGQTFNRTSGPGLGNIEFDKVLNQFYVSNFEDGKIYRLDIDGNILGDFDPQTLTGFTPDDGSAGFAGDFKPYGLAVAPDQSRLYFGIHPVDDDPATSLTDANVYFVELAADGSFSGTEQFLVTTTPDPSGSAFGADFNAFGRNPAWYSISDLNFDPNGNLVIGHRSGCGVGTDPFFASSHNHGASFFIYDFTDGTLLNLQTRYAGDLGNDNVTFNDGSGNDDVYGGIGIWNTHDGNFLYVVSSSDIRNELGPHGLLVFPDDFTQTGNGTTEYILRPSAAIPYFENFAQSDFKGVGGDIEMFSPCGQGPVQIGNYAWIDADEDGIQDPCEPPLTNLPVTLYTQDDDGTLTQVDMTTTDPLTGEYYFNDVIPDTSYLIVFGDLTGPDSVLTYNGDGYAVTTDSIGEGDNPGLNDSDVTIVNVNGLNLPSIAYSTADTTDHTLDAGFTLLPVFSVGSTVFLDNNNDGLQNGADTGIALVEVQLWDVATGTQLLTDANGLLVTDPAMTAPVLTDANGNYLFYDLPEGNYYIVLPSAPAAAPLSSNETSSGFMETSPADNTDNDDEGLQPGGSGTMVSSDTFALRPGLQPLSEPAQGGGQDTIAALGLTDENGNMTLDFGFFAPVSIGDTAFVDLNEDGLQTPGEPGLGGVTVTLLDSNGDTVTTDASGMMISGTTTTAPDGTYSFDGLPPGEYSVIFDISTADNAEFYDFTLANAGDATNDSDNATILSDSTAQSAPTGFLNSGEQEITLDVGVVCAVEVAVSEPFTICATGTINLDEGTSITPSSLGGVWSTPDGTGTFVDASGNPVAAPYPFGAALQYLPSEEDARQGFVTLILTSNEPDGPCRAVVGAEVTVTILNVNCGDFFWNGE